MAALLAMASFAAGRHLRADDTVQDLLDHQAVSGFARLLLPWDDRTYDGRLPLRDIGTLLPYHSHVDPAAVVGGLNALIDDALAGRPVFHDIYTAPEKAEDATKA